MHIYSYNASKEDAGFFTSKPLLLDITPTFLVMIAIGIILVTVVVFVMFFETNILTGVVYAFSSLFRRIRSKFASQQRAVNEEEHSELT